MQRIDRRTIEAQWRSGGPVITVAIIAVCVAVWIVEMLTYMLSPTLFARLMSPLVYAPAYVHIEPWTWFSSMFVHAPNLMHILFNMVALWSVGPVLERMMGHWRYLALYVISGLGAAVGISAWCSITGNWAMSAYGASGALFGLFAAVLVVFRRIGADIRSMLIWMAVNFALPIVIPNIAWQAHVGGFIIGGALTWLLVSGVPAWRKWSFTRRMWVYGGTVTGLLVVALVLL